MKTSLSRITLAIMALLLCLATIAPAAMAQELPLSVQVEAEITAEGTLPEQPDNRVVRLTADDEANPMPNGQKGGSYDLTVANAGKATFPAMTFDKLGVYTYTIQQIAGSYEDCKYDARVYVLTISVVNGENGGYEVSVSMRESDKTEKTDAALFHNVYKTIVTPPGNITETGVNDMWPWYMGGSAALLIVAFIIVRALRRREDGSSEGK